MTTRLAHSSIKLLISNTLYRGGRIVFQIFLNIILWKQTQDLQVIALFNIAFTLFHLIGFAWIAPLVKKGHGKIINTLSFMAFILSYLFLIFHWEILLEYPYIWAWFFGFFNGLYYTNYNIVQFELTHFWNRGNFEWTKKAYKIIGRIIFPLLIWIIIGFYNIEAALAFWMVLFFMAWFLSKDFSMKKSGQLDYKNLMIAMKQDKRLIYSLLATFFFAAGFSMSLIEVLIPLMIYYTDPSEIKLWFSLSLLSLWSIVLMYVFGRFVKYKHYSVVLPVLWVTFVWSLLLLLWTSDHKLLILLWTIVTTVITLFSIPGWVISTNVLHAIPDYKKYIAEHTILREAALVPGWIFAFWTMYFASDLTAWGLNIVFYSMIICSIISTILFMKVKVHEIEE